MRKIKSSRLLSLLVALFLFSQNAFSQTVVTGTVTDKNGKGIPGVTVAVKGTSTATQTDNNGHFSIIASGNAVLVLSSVGYATTEVPVQNRNTIATTLGTLESSLDEVIVIGYGTTRRKDLTGAVSSVQAKDFNKGIYTAADQLIQGKVAGVQVINNTGQPGGATTVKIRGNASLTGSGQPLYVVDGVLLDGRSVQPGFSTPQLGNTPGTNPLNFINPNDIASVEVLKDASATAIYGSRGAYGVVLITTKKGQSGQPRIDFNTSVGVSSIMRQIKVLNASQFRQALDYYGVNKANDLGGNVNAMDAILRKGIQQNHNIAVSGGTENGRYRLSFGYLNQEGIVRKSDFTKYTANFSANFKFLESKKLGLDVNVIPSQYVQGLVPIVNDAGANGNLIANALQWNPTDPLRKADGSLNIKYGSSVLNPLGVSEAYNDQSKVTTILGSISPYFKFTNWLDYRMLLSLNYSSGIRRASIQQWINLNDINNKGWATIANNELLTQQVTHTLNFNRQIAANLNLNAVVGYEYTKYKNRGSSTSGYGNAANGGFGNYGLDYTNYIQASDPSTRLISSFVDPTYEIQSYFARAIFNFKDKYLLTATFRADGDSKFGKNNKYGYFPSFAAAWNIKKEDFFNVDFFNTLKLRGGWGKTGNESFPGGASIGRYVFQNGGSVGQSNNPNPDLKWQSDKQYNIGLDLSIFNNRISATVDYFNKNTTDLLYPTAPIQPAPPGSVVTWKNLPGTIENKGIEATVNAAIIKKKDFSWDFSVYATFIKNNVSGMPAPIYTGQLNGQGVSGTTVEVIRNGLPMNAFFTRQYIGMDKASGQAVYADNGSTFYYVGNPNPKTILGFSTTASYKRLSLVVNMNGALGQYIYNNTLNNVINVGSINGGRNIALSVFQAPVKESFANPVTASSRFIEKGSYLKMANATLSYTIGDVVKTFKNASVFVTGQNLFVITKFSGFDPEVNVDKSVNGVPSVGIEYTPYPSARLIILGVNFSF